MEYKPNLNVVRSARSFIRSLCETYGTEQGMAVWDRTREVLGEQAASDIFLGMLTGRGSLTVARIGGSKIDAIKNVRQYTGLGLREAKDFIDKVDFEGPQTMPEGLISSTEEDNFINSMRRIGCVVE